MEENKNIPAEGEAATPEAPTAEPPGVDIPAPDLNTGPAAPLEQGGITPADPGDVVVSFDKIEEFMAERRAAARAAVEQAEPTASEVEAPTVERSGAIQPEQTADKSAGDKPKKEIAEEGKKLRRGRPPKEAKTEQAPEKAEQSQDAAKPRRGRPAKADKAAPGEAQPPKPRAKLGLLTKWENIICCGRIKEKAGGGLDATEAAHGNDRRFDAAGTLSAEAGGGAGSVFCV